MGFERPVVLLGFCKDYSKHVGLFTTCFYGGGRKDSKAYVNI